MPKILLFDLGGVLVRNDMFSELGRLSPIRADEAELKSRWLKNSAARRFELGQCSPERFARDVVQDFKLAMDEQAFLDAFQYWPKGLDDTVVDMLAALRAVGTVCCLSNSNVLHWTDTLTTHFDRAFSSHEIGCIKPDQAAFEYVLTALEAAPEDIVFFDDAQLNVEAAAALGIDARLTQGVGEVVVHLKRLGYELPASVVSSLPNHL